MQWNRTEHAMLWPASWSGARDESPKFSVETTYTPILERMNGLLKEWALRVRARRNEAIEGGESPLPQHLRILDHRM
jgi:hypothetical protein